MNPTPGETMLRETREDTMEPWMTPRLLKKLGKVPDTQIAASAGVSASRVRTARRKRGIQAFRGRPDPVFELVADFEREHGPIPEEIYEEAERRLGLDS